MTAAPQDVAARFARLDRYIADGKLLRNSWHEGPKGPDGYDRACLLMAIAPEVDGDSPNSARCPAWLLPAWLAQLTPWIDDRGTIAAWPEQVQRYSRSVRHVPALSDEAKTRLLYAVRAAILRCVVPHAGTSLPVVERVLALCERAAKGEAVASDEWHAAAAAARWAARWAAAWHAAAAAAAEAAEAARWAAAAAAARGAPLGAEADRIIDAILTAIESAVAEVSP